MARVQQKHHPEPTLKVLRVEQGTVKLDMGMNRMKPLRPPASQIIEDGFAVLLGDVGRSLAGFEGKALFG